MVIKPLLLFLFLLSIAYAHPGHPQTYNEYIQGYHIEATIYPQHILVNQKATITITITHLDQDNIRPIVTINEQELQSKVSDDFVYDYQFTSVHNQIEIAFNNQSVVITPTIEEGGTTPSPKHIGYVSIVVIIFLTTLFYILLKL